MNPDRFVARHMRGYRPPYWVMDTQNVGNGTDGAYRHQEEAERHAKLRNAGVRREVASAAVYNGQEVIRVGDLVFLDVLFIGLIPAKVLTIGRVPVPGAPNDAYTQIQVTVKLTATRGAFKRGEVLVKTGNLECSSIIPRASVRTVSGSIRIRSGVFDV